MKISIFEDNFEDIIFNSFEDPERRFNTYF